MLVLRSSVNDEQVAIAERIVRDRGEARDGRFLVGYFSGTSSHREDFALVEDALCSFLERHDDAALVLGGSLELSERLVALMARGRVIAVPRVDYVTLQYLQASVDVVLAPLVVDEFTNCKSGLKVFEAAIVGTPACASPAFAYREAIEEGVTGYVCETTADWERALEALRSDRDACRRMGDAARAYALERYYGDAVRAQAEQVLAELLAAPSLSVRTRWGARFRQVASPTGTTPSRRAPPSRRHPPGPPPRCGPSARARAGGPLRCGIWGRGTVVAADRPVLLGLYFGVFSKARITSCRRMLQREERPAQGRPACLGSKTHNARQRIRAPAAKIATRQPG